MVIRRMVKGEYEECDGYDDDEEEAEHLEGDEEL